MKRFRWMAMFLVGVMLLAISGSAFAAVKDDTVSPLYLYTRKVTASLSISDGGKATCYGYVRGLNIAKTQKYQYTAISTGIPSTVKIHYLCFLYSMD